MILGAIGCGEFGCNPKEVALIFKEVLCEFNQYSLTIIFAIPGELYNVFRDVI